MLLREKIHVEIGRFLGGDSMDEELAFQELRKLNRHRKRMVDACVAMLLLVVLSPLILLIALLIKLESRGPVFFVQSRTGFMGRRFKMYKFRTMVQDAESLKEHLVHLNVHAEHSPDFKIKNDPRVTTLGLFLRKFSLDEIPQLFNVILGNMRLVGPRPTSFSADEYKTEQLARLLVFPGLTGMWQISGRSNTSFDERVEIDRAYISEYRFLLDMKILLHTPLAVIKGDGAY